MYYGERLIISYIHYLDSNRYVFQLAGGEEVESTWEEYSAHWQTYREHEQKRAAEALEHYRPLPVTQEIRLSLKVAPASAVARRQRREPGTV